MLIEKKIIESLNNTLLTAHKRKFEFAAEAIPDVKSIIEKLIAFQIAIPSWALGTGGTRFGRFPDGGDPRNLEEKIE
ncbi:MAG TPA: sugar isomerase, partial [Puia sp.]